MADPYSDNVVLALPFDQDAPGVRGTLDYSTYKKALTWVGDAKLSSTQSKYGDVSCYFYGTDDMLYIAGATSLDIRSADFTIELWFYATYLNYYSRLLNFNSTWTTNSVCINWNSSESNIVFSVYNLANPLLSTLTPPTMNAWHHIAITRLGSLFTMWLDGVSQSTATNAGALFATSSPYITLGNGDVSIGGYYSPFGGYIDDLRITKGIARYTADFTPPTAFKGDYPAPPDFHGINIPVLNGQSAFQWCLLDKKGVQIPVEYNARINNLNLWWGGLGSVSGTVKIGTTPCKRRVRLYEANTGILLWEKWTAEDGSYSFLGLRTDFKYTITSTDCSNFYNDVIAANITAIV